MQSSAEPPDPHSSGVDENCGKLPGADGADGADGVVGVWGGAGDCISL